MKKTSIIPMIIFLLILTLVVNHLLRGLLYQPLLVLLAISFGLVVAANIEIKDKED